MSWRCRNGAVFAKVRKSGCLWRRRCDADVSLVYTQCVACVHSVKSVIGFAPGGLTVVKYLKSAFQTFMSRLLFNGLDVCQLIIFVR
jgi:hypothetical protein